jgi:hypothetical protein
MSCSSSRISILALAATARASELCPTRSKRYALFALTLAVASCGVNGAGAEIIWAQDMLRGIETTRARCAATPNTVWVSAYGYDFCVRYYVSTIGGNGRRPVVFLQGDRLGAIDPATKQWKDVEKFTDINTADLQRAADAFSSATKTTAIYVGRIGVEGTSGNHMDRHTLLELRMVNAALDAIKLRYGFEGFHLAGQSGGSLLIGGLIGLRSDIACAVPGSGRLGLQTKVRAKEPERNRISPIDAIPAALQNRSLHLYLVTDPADQKVPVKQQVSFATAMGRAGRPITNFFVEAADKDHHGVTAFTRIVVVGCIQGKSDREIGAELDILSKRNAEKNRQTGQAIASSSPSAPIAGNGPSSTGGVNTSAPSYNPPSKMAARMPARPPFPAPESPIVTSALPATAAPCLHKIYLQTGVVLFRDVCAQEWAINTTSVTTQVAAEPACLAKNNAQNGVVLFRDLCTSEWAMNPPLVGNQAQIN